MLDCISNQNCSGRDIWWAKQYRVSDPHSWFSARYRVQHYTLITQPCCPGHKCLHIGGSDLVFSLSLFSLSYRWSSNSRTWATYKTPPPASSLPLDHHAIRKELTSTTDCQPPFARGCSSTGTQKESVRLDTMSPLICSFHCFCLPSVFVDVNLTP